MFQDAVLGFLEDVQGIMLMFQECLIMLEVLKDVLHINWEL